MADIGYQDGIDAFEEWFRKLSASITKHNEWVQNYIAWSKLPDSVRLTADPPIPPTFPKIPLEGPLFNEKDMNTWPWPRKFFKNTIRTLKDDHDAAVGPSNPEEPPPPPPPARVAPRTFNKVLPNGSDARFCITGLPRHDSGLNAGLPYDDFTTYDNNGLDKSGGRDPNRQVPGLRQANSMDQYGPCDLYPPLTAWPPESYLR